MARGNPLPPRGAKATAGGNARLNVVVLLLALLGTAAGLVFAICCNGSGARDAPAENERTAEVIGAFLRRWMADRGRAPTSSGGGPAVLLIRELLPGPRTAPFQRPSTPEELQVLWAALHSKWPELKRDTWDSLAATAEANGDLQALLASAELPGAQFLSKQEVWSVFDGSISEGWAQLRRRWPGVVEILRVSAVGVSEAANQALLYAEWSADLAAGGGVFALMSRVGDEWVVKDVYHTWLA